MSIVLEEVHLLQPIMDPQTRSIWALENSYYTYNLAI